MPQHHKTERGRFQTLKLKRLSFEKREKAADKHCEQYGKQDMLLPNVKNKIKIQKIIRKMGNKEKANAYTKKI